MEQHTKEPTLQDAPGTELIYLASPYTHENPLVVADRHRSTMTFVAKHLLDGRFIYSPVVYAHTMAMRYSLPSSAEWWWAFNKTMIERCNVVWVLCLAGYEHSRGVRDELDYAEVLDKPIKYWNVE